MQEWRPSKAAAIFEGCFYLLIFGLVVLYSVRPNWDIDIYWHIATGKWIEEHRALPSTDIFSATDQTRPWTPFQWLYEVIVYEIEARAGFLYVRVLHGALFASAFILFALWFRRVAPGRIGAAFLMTMALVLSEDRFRIRPEAFNFFFLALTLPELISPSLSRGGLLKIVLVSALWANIHAGGALLLVVCSLGVLGARLVGTVMGGQRVTLRSDMLRFGASALPMLPMPGFIKGVQTAFGMLEESAVLIPEWHPPAAYFMPELAGRLTTHHVLCGTLPYLVLFGVGALLAKEVLSRGAKEALRGRDPGLWALALIFSVLGTRSARFIYLSAVACGVLAFAFRAEGARIMGRMGPKLFVIVAGGLLVGTSYEYSVILQRGGLKKALKSLRHDHEPGEFPEGASDAIEGMGLRGRIFHLTKWGGYLIYRHFPRCTIFTDGRGNFTREEKEALIATHRPFEREEALEEAWRRFSFDIVIFPPPVFPLLSWDMKKWMLVYHDDVAEVFLRRSEENKANIERALKYWARMGIDTRGGPEAFQAEYRRVLGVEFMGRKENRKRALSAIRRIGSGEPEVRASGLYDLGMLYFSAGRFGEAEKALLEVLRMGFYHSTAILYIAWSRYLVGDLEGARRALRDLVEKRGLQGEAGGKDYGPLMWAGRKILGLLAAKVGVGAEDMINSQDGRSLEERR